MNRRELISMLGAAAALPAAAQTTADLSAEDRAKIEAAIPSKAPVTPAAPRRILISSMVKRPPGRPQNGHASIPAAQYALRLLGEKTGAYEVEFGNDAEMLAADNLARFDAFLFVNSGGVLTDDPALRLSLLDFVAGGKGFVGFHSAVGTFVQYPVYDQFPAYGEMIGGYENGGHPWRANETMTLQVEDPANPVNAAFGGKKFEISDEADQFMDGIFTREKLHVLLSVAPESIENWDPNRFLPERRADHDFPIAWIKRYGLGRVYYNALGHNLQTWWNPMLLQHFLAGIQFATGDLKADTTPSITKPGGRRG